LGLVLLVYGCYVLIRVIIDAATPKTTTGQVLWLRVWRTRGGSENSPAVPWLYYAAIDDGHADHTTAWGLPADLERRCDTGDTVTVKIRRWSRRVVSVEIVQRGAAGFTTAAVPVPNPPAIASGPSGASASPIPGLLGAILGGSSVSGANLLTAEEVSQALGQPVEVRTASAGPVAMTTFVTQPKGRTVLMVQVLQGSLVEAMWQRRMAGAAPLTGIGDGAWVDGYRGAVRSGDTFVAVTLAGSARKNTAALPQLLTRAVARIPRQAAPAD
jgi:hypothetical protein